MRLYGALFRDTTNSPRHDSIDNYRSPPSNLHQQHGGTLSSPNHSSLHSPTRRQVAAVTTSIQEPCGNCDNRHHTTVTCPHIRFCLQCDRVAEDSNHYPSDCNVWSLSWIWLTSFFTWLHPVSFCITFRLAKRGAYVVSQELVPVIYRLSSYIVMHLLCNR